MNLGDTMDTVKHYLTQRMRRKKMPSQETRSVRVTVQTYILARMHAEEQNITIQESMSRLVGMAMMRAYTPEQRKESATKDEATKRADALRERKRQRWATVLLAYAQSKKAAETQREDSVQGTQDNTGLAADSQGAG